MENTKLIEILKSLDKDEFKQFGRFVNSVFFVNRKNVYVLYEELRKLYPDFSGGLQKETLFGKMFPAKPYNDTLMRKYISELQKALMEYLSYKNFRKDGISYNKHLANELSEKRFFDLSLNLINESYNIVNNTEWKNEEYFHNMYLLQEAENRIPVGGVSYYVDTEKNKQQFTESVEAFTGFIELSALRYYSSVLGNLRFFKPECDYTIIEDIFASVEKSLHKMDDIMKIYYYMIKSLKDPRDSSYFYELKSLVIKNSRRLDSRDLFKLLLYFNNYTYDKVEKGFDEFLKDKFEINKVMLDRKAFFSDKYMKGVLFDSYTINALLLNEISWTENFINSYQQYLDPDEKDNTVNYNLAQLFLHKKEFDKALTHLGKIKFKNYFEKVKTHSLNLVIYYEAGLLDSALSLAHTFRHFLSTHKKVLPYTKERGLAYVEGITAVIKYRLGESKLNRDELKRKILKPEGMISRKWLLKKIDELE